MKYILFCLLTSGTLIVYAQKPPIDFTALKNWECGEGSAIISPDGNYVCFNIKKISGDCSSLVIKSTVNNWIKEFRNGTMPGFTNDSKLIIIKTGDSLCLSTLGGEDIVIIPHVNSYKIPDAGQGIWLTYTLINSPKELILRNLVTGYEQHFSSVISSQFTSTANFLLLEQLIKKDTGIISTLQLVNLSTGEIKTMWAGIQDNEKVSNCTFDISEKQLAFIIESKRDNQLVYKLWYYKTGMNNAVMLADDKTPGIEEGMVVSGQKPEFTKSGNRIFIGLQFLNKLKIPFTNVKVDIWSYSDTKLQSGQLQDVSSPKIYTFVIDISEKRLMRLENEDEKMVAHSDDWGLILHGLPGSYLFESGWNLSAQYAYYVVSLSNTSKRLIKNHIANYSGWSISPGGKWIIYYDFRLKNYFSYEISTGIIRNISKGIVTSWTLRDDQYPEPLLPSTRKGWVGNDEAILINDNFDIWQLDPGNKVPPFNLTNSYGRRHHIIFELLNGINVWQDFAVEKKSILLLKTFDKKNKNMGFYTKVQGVTGDPHLCNMGPYRYGTWNGEGTFNYPPIIAQGGSKFIVLRESANEAPNAFLTSDFKNFTALTDVQPQKAYNWMTTELIHWKTFDGNPATGILYKPENFDSHKKYPVIFDYYEKRSDELNFYIQPNLADGRINIPWFVSNCYLVFVPDIDYKMGEPGQSAYNSILSAAIYLSKMPWVDAKKMGLQGHSFGGYETNFLVTHSKIFAAACSASGFCDLVSFYGSSARSGYPVYWAESSQGRMGATPWKIPDLYIKNSPIFNADKVTTPLLMMNNKGDYVVPFEQGVQFFTALRRLGKKVWMLQYDDGRHEMGSDESAKDYTIRMTQFFDHYLKGAQAPKWMVEGIPAKMKGIDDGLELEPAGIEPGPGLLKN